MCFDLILHLSLGAQVYPCCHLFSESVVLHLHIVIVIDTVLDLYLFIAVMADQDLVVIL